MTIMVLPVYAPRLDMSGWETCRHTTARLVDMTDMMAKVKNNIIVAVSSTFLNTLSCASENKECYNYRLFFIMIMDGGLREKVGNATHK